MVKVSAGMAEDLEQKTASCSYEQDEVIEVRAYETSDGTLHRSRRQAQAHAHQLRQSEKARDLAAWLDDNTAITSSMVEGVVDALLRDWDIELKAKEEPPL